MGKFAQYRFLKKVKKMLDRPVKSEDSYDVSARPIYIGDKRWRRESDERNPDHGLRRTQVNEIASMLLQQIGRLEPMLRGGADAMGDDGDRAAVGNAFIDIAVALAELDAVILFTEAEKAARRQKVSVLGSRLDLESDSTGNDEERLALLGTRIQDWQLESQRKQRKVKQIETTVRDLGLNVNDVRCAKILSEKNDAVAASDAVVTAGARLCRETGRTLEAILAVAQGETSA
jgi:hypothetical protein